MQTTGDSYETNLETALVKQTPTIGGWVCSTCVNYNGNLSCKKNMFIAFVGANTKDCLYYESGTICRHCGKVT